MSEVTKEKNHGIVQKYTKMLLSEESVIQFIFEKFAGSIKYGQLKLDLRSIELLIS